jgi:hypothetical protein
LTAVAAILAVASTSGPSAAVAPIGKTVQASSTVKASGGAGARILKSATPIYFNDVLQSNATGVGQFQFVDGTKLAMGPNASIVIDQFVYKGGQTLQRLGIETAKGAFRFISGRSGSSAYKIVTPAGTLGVRGTAVDVTVRGGKAYVVLLKGNAQFCSGRKCQVLRRTCDYVVAGGGQVSEPEHLAKGIPGADAKQVFPLLANQGRLSSSFRLPGRSCLSRMVRQLDRTAPSSNPTAVAEALSAPARQNNGFGNGPEAGDGPSDTSNPGRFGATGPPGKNK